MGLWWDFPTIHSHRSSHWNASLKRRVTRSLRLYGRKCNIVQWPMCIISRLYSEHKLLWILSVGRLIVMFVLRRVYPLVEGAIDWLGLRECSLILQLWLIVCISRLRGQPQWLTRSGCGSKLRGRPTGFEPGRVGCLSSGLCIYIAPNFSKGLECVVLCMALCTIKNTRSYSKSVGHPDVVFPSVATLPLLCKKRRKAIFIHPRLRLIARYRLRRWFGFKLSRRLGAKGSYLPLWRVSDRIL